MSALIIRSLTNLRTWIPPGNVGDALYFATIHFSNVYAQRENEFLSQFRAWQLTTNKLIFRDGSKHQIYCYLTVGEKS